MMQAIAEFSGPMAKIQGPARSGKTEALVRRCAHLLEQGTDATTMLVVVSSEFARIRFLERLVDAVDDSLKDQAGRVVVSTALAICTRILDDPRARQATGRVPRMLVDAEYSFFVEDLKTLGQKNQRLSNMLAFFYAQWSAFEDEQEWLIPGEETTVLGHARDVLGLYEAMLRHEAPYMCGKLLLSEEGKPLAHRFDYVFCDDFQNLSHAEQTCMCLCARKQLIVSGNPNQATKVNTAYPSAKGFEQFERVRKGVEVFTLEEAFGIEQAVALGEALCTAPGMRSDLAPTAIEPTGSKALFLEWSSPEDEMESLAVIVESFCASNPAARPGDVTIAAPTKRWGRLARAALERHGIHASVAGLNPSLGGDPRAIGRHDAQTAYAKLCLAAAPEDALAWRVWGGFDHALTHSEMWRSLQKRALETGSSLYEVLKAAAEDGAAVSDVVIAKSETLKQTWESGRAVIDQCAHLQGAELACAVGMMAQPEFDEILDGLKGDENAAALRDAVRAHLALPHFPASHNAVRIALYENLCGLDCPCLIAPGMVDGLIPFRDAFEVVKNDAERTQVMDDDRKRTYSFISKGTGCLIASSFAEADVETAERSKMKVSRISSSGGARIAHLSRSSFFEEAADARPCFEAGTRGSIERLFKRE